MRSVIIERAIKKGEKQGFDLGKVQGYDLGKVQGYDLGKVQGYDLDKKQGENSGEQRSIINMVLTLMRKNSISSDDAMEFLDISQDKRTEILKDPMFLSATNHGK